MKQEFAMKFTIWGCGVRGKSLFEVLGRDRVLAFIDSDKSKQGSTYRGCPVVSFDEYVASFADDSEVVISSLYHEEEIIKCLRNSEIDFWWSADEEPSEYMGHGIPDFWKYLPLPDNKEKQYVIIGTSLHAYNCYCHFKANGYRNTVLYSEDAGRRSVLEKKYGCHFTDSISGILPRQCYVASREDFVAKQDRSLMTDLFDMSRYIPAYQHPELAALKDSEKGETCFIIGNGPSLRLNDLLAIRGVKCFGSNRIYMLEDSWVPDYYVCCDKYVLTSGKIAGYVAGIKFLPDIYAIDGSEKGTVYTFHADRGRGRRIHPVGFSDDITRKINFFNTVSFTAIQIAAYMGFKTIYLLGMDCDYTPDCKGRTHFYGLDPLAAGDHQQERSVDDFEAAKCYAESHGIKIYNATRGGNLEVFERVDFDSLPFLKPKTEE